MEFSFEAKVVLRLKHTPGTQKVEHAGTDFNIYPSKELDEKCYLDKNGLPTADGSHALTQTLVQGLVGNIHLAHQKGFRDSAEHLRYIISELEKGFVENAKVMNSKF